MTDRYPVSELLKILPQSWIQGWVGTVEEIEDDLRVKLGKENDLLPSGRVRPLIELVVEDRGSEKEALDFIDEEMQESPYEAQMFAQVPFMKKERSVVEEKGRKYYLISEPDLSDPTFQNKTLNILYNFGRFLVKLTGSNTVLTTSLADEIIQRLDFAVELKMPENSGQNDRGNVVNQVVEIAYAPFLKEAEALQEETKILETMYQEKKISDEEYERRKTELQTKGLQLTQKLCGINSGMAAQFTQTASLTKGICPSCGTPVGDVKFCPICGTKIEVEKNCPNCGAKVLANARFCQECGSPIKGV